MDTKKVLSDAMFHLLKTKKLEKISVQMILDESNVSRSTFYRLFTDKYELMNWCYKSYVDLILIKVLNMETTWLQGLRGIFQFINDNHGYFENALKVQGKNSFSNFLYEYSYKFYEKVYLSNKNSKELSNQEKMIIEFNCVGAVYLVVKWLSNGRNESVADMADLVFSLIPERLRIYF